MNNLIKEYEINFLMNFKKGYLLTIREGLTVTSAHPHALELSMISMQEFHRKPKYIPCAWNIKAKTVNLINKTTYKPSISIFRKHCQMQRYQNESEYTRSYQALLVIPQYVLVWARLTFLFFQDCCSRLGCSESSRRWWRILWLRHLSSRYIIHSLWMSVFTFIRVPIDQGNQGIFWKLFPVREMEKMGGGGNFKSWKF